MIEESFGDSLLNFFMFFILLCLLFEIGLWIYAYVNADKVECNLLWCTFTSGDTITIKDSYQNITTHSECFINHERVNCSEIEKYTNKIGGLLP